MTRQETSINNKLRAWYFSLSLLESKPKREAIITMCDISVHTWGNWIGLRSPIKRPYQEIINKVAGYNIFESNILEYADQQD